jgi:hypothetical protein
MSHKDLLVVLDPGLQARGRIELAAALAERFGAHLVGLYPLPTPQALESSAISIPPCWIRSSRRRVSEHARPPIWTPGS